MFTVYHSNRLEVLADQLTVLIRQPTDSPFVLETIVVQSLGLARCLVGFCLLEGERHDPPTQHLQAPLTRRMVRFLSDFAE
jgi:hypothetical protein